LMLTMLRSLGFVANEEKCDPPSTRQVFLGVGMCSETMQYFFTEERLGRMRQASWDLEQAGKRVRVSRVLSVIGQWQFLATVVPGVAVYLRSGYDCVGRRGPREFVSLTRQLRLDLAFLRSMIVSGSLTVSMTRRPLTEGFGAWDACTRWGMGGYLDGMYFCIPWDALMAGDVGRVESFFPFQAAGTEHINYLELFAAYWFLRTWGERLKGHCIVCHTDSMSVKGMLRNMFGKATFIPLLKEILRLTVRYDVSLDVHYVWTKHNVLADSLSRGAVKEFTVHLQRFMDGGGRAEDGEDYQVLPERFEELDRLVGPFELDACVDRYRTNSHCRRSWNAEDDCRKQRWHGLTVWCNGPFSQLYEILVHFLRCKQEEPVGTAALFILPMWVPSDFMSLVHSRPDVFRVVARYPTGTALFTAPAPPNRGGGRRYLGPTRWPVLAVWAGPEPPATPICV